MPDLYPYQEEAVQRALAAPLRRHVLSFGTGLGKTRTAWETARRQAPRSVLVIAPAVARLTWVRELEKVWPDHPEVGCLSLGKRRKAGVSKVGAARREAAYNAPIQIVSYNLAREVTQAGWDVIIADECHKLKNPRSKQTKIVRDLVRGNPNASVLGLTATLIPNRIQDLWSPLDIIWPGRWGRPQANGDSSFEFKDRYMLCDMVEVQGKMFRKWVGENPDHIEELRERLLSVCSRVTRADVTHLLGQFPPVSVVEIEPVGTVSTNWRTYYDTPRKEKLAYVKEWAEDAHEEGDRKLLVFTHLKASANIVAAHLKKYGPVRVLTGDMPADKRNAHAQAFAKAECGYIVATIDSCGESINGLDAAKQVLFVELLPRPSAIIQACGRVNRLGSEPATITFAALRNSLDVTIIDMVQTKLQAANAAQRGDSVAAQLEHVFSTYDDESFLAQLDEIAGCAETDYVV